MAPRRNVKAVPARRGNAKAKHVAQAAAAKARRGDSSDYDSDGSYTEYSDEGSSSQGSDEDDPREYKHGGYHPVSPYQLYTARYRVLSKLGAGAFSTVWLCADEKEANAYGPNLVAVKICKSRKSVTEQAVDEIELLERLQDKDDASAAHFVRMHNHFWHSGPNGRHKCMVFEVMGENLLAMVKYYDYNGLPLAMVKRIARHTMMGLEYIHSRGVIHTDVKLENVLVQRHDLGELVKEACRAHRAYMETRAGFEGMSKNQKKRAKKKEKQKNAKAEAEGNSRSDKPEAVVAAAAADNEDGEDADPDEAAARACGQPTPPVRQKERFETLLLEQVFAKLADFGNGCKADRKVTDDIQTRQYRSPEVIIGQEWDETADNWSSACMFFELITGDFLFDPRTGDNWSRDEDHLALMTELICENAPKDWVTGGKYSRDFYTNAGKLKHIKDLKMWGLTKVLQDKYEIEQDEAESINEFLMPMLTWLPAKRQRASEALKSRWIRPEPGEVDTPPDPSAALAAAAELAAAAVAAGESPKGAATPAPIPRFDFSAPPRGSGDDEAAGKGPAAAADAAACSAEAAAEEAKPEAAATEEAKPEAAKRSPPQEPEEPAAEADVKALPLPTPPKATSKAKAKAKAASAPAVAEEADGKGKAATQELQAVEAVATDQPKQEEATSAAADPDIDDEELLKELEGDATKKKKKKNKGKK